MERPIKGAAGVPVVENVFPLGGPPVALLPLWTLRISAERHWVGLQQYAMLIKIEATRGICTTTRSALASVGGGDAGQRFHVANPASAKPDATSPIFFPRVVVLFIAE